MNGSRIEEHLWMTHPLLSLSRAPQDFCGMAFELLFWDSRGHQNVSQPALVPCHKHGRRPSMYIRNACRTLYCLIHEKNRQEDTFCQMVIDEARELLEIW